MPTEHPYRDEPDADVEEGGGGNGNDDYDDLLQFPSEEGEENNGHDQTIPEPSIADSTDLRIRSVSPVPVFDDHRDRSSSSILPVWLREQQQQQQSSSSFFSALFLRRWRWGRQSCVPLLPLRKTARFVADWTAGPKIPQIQRIQPLLPVVQEAPLWLVRRFLPKRTHKVVALAVVYLAWLVTFVAVLRHTAESGYVDGYGVPQALWCGANLWAGGNGCGLDGNNCRPFNNASMAFRCNANCAGMMIAEPYPVGDQLLSYEPLVVGGPEEATSSKHEHAVYRADSFICQAAVHAGVISDQFGGCGVLHLVGAHDDYPGSERNGIRSHAFDSSFPKSYTFDRSVPAECGVVDLRWPLLAVTAVYTSIISLFVSSPAVFFASIFSMLFFHVGLVSDKPNISDYNSLFSLMVGRFLPAAFCGFVIYRYCVRPQLAGLTAQIEKTILWLGGAWVGSLSNYTLDFIPIQRLTPHDIQAQPGAIAALVTICILLFVIACGQVYYLRQECRLRTYLVLYGLMAAALLLCVALPTLHLRIHHYILALLLLPGTRPQTRPGLLYQGLLVGLFINGTARWGFDSLLQTAAALRSGGQPVGSLLPNVTAVVANSTSFITFFWPPLPPEGYGYDGLSILVNDVERHRWYVGEGASSWTWYDGHSQNHESFISTDRDNGVATMKRRSSSSSTSRIRGPKHPDYFRFAYMRGSSAADYTRAGVWDKVNGEWREMEDGPSVGAMASRRSWLDLGWLLG